MTVDRRAVLKRVVAGGVLAAAPGWAFAQGSASSRPETIPALREWTPASGGFRLGSPARIVLAPGHADALGGDAEVFAEDLRALLGVAVQVVVRSGKPKAGEVTLRLGAADPQLGDEGYALDIGPAAVVTANKPAGVFYGTRSLLQLLPRGNAVPAGRARDWPRYAERGLCLDIGRKHLSYEWLEARVYELAFLKLNYLQLHFTEDLGWRIESDRTPPVHSDVHLTKAQVAALVELAARHHITVVPEIDLPGHMTAGLAQYPQFQLKDVLGRANPGKLDYSIPGARQFVRELIEEYLPLFPGPYWHAGMDEYLPPAEYYLYPQLERYARERYGSEATVKDGVIGLANEINALVRGYGKTLRVWHDGLSGGRAVTLDENVNVEWWTDVSPLGDLLPPKPQELLDQGHRIQNASWYPTYYTNLPAYMPVPRPDLKGMYETWAVHRFRGALYVDGTIGGPYHDIDPGEPHNLGSKLHVWNDDPEKETEQQIAAGIRPRLRVMAQQTWESPKLVPTYPEFAQLIDRVGNPPR
jgi:hexosaminidase